MRRLNAACAGLADFTPPNYAGSGFHILGRFTNTRNLPTSKLNDLQFDGNNKEIQRDNLIEHHLNAYSQFITNSTLLLRRSYP